MEEVDRSQRMVLGRAAVSHGSQVAITDCSYWHRIVVALTRARASEWEAARMQMTIWTATATETMRHVTLSRMVPLVCCQRTASVQPEVGASGRDLGNVGRNAGVGIWGTAESRASLSDSACSSLSGSYVTKRYNVQTYVGSGPKAEGGRRTETHDTTIKTWSESAGKQSCRHRARTDEERERKAQSESGRF
jgi:hypothetical protein